MSLLSISAVIITKNEASNIKRCIAALQQVVSEIMIVDSNSTDQTIAIAKEMGAKVVQTAWVGYGHNKNFGNRLTTNDWILSIDADEVLSAELIQTLQKLVLDQDQVYAINRLVNYAGHWVYYSGWHPDWKIRLFHKATIQWDEEALVHEQLIIPTTKTVTQLEGVLYHYSYKSEVDHWNRIERYATLAAQQMAQQNREVGYLKLYGSPIARFLKTFFLKKGFMDGRLGWKISWRNAYLVYRKYALLKLMMNAK